MSKQTKPKPQAQRGDPRKISPSAEREAERIARNLFRLPAKSNK